MAKLFHLVWIHGIPPHASYSQRTQSLSNHFPQATINQFTLLGGYTDEISQPAFLQERARDTLEEILSARQDELPVVLIGHQLGGFLVKQILALAGRSPHYDSITLRIAGILYVDFPNLPLDAALWPGHVMGLLAKYTPNQIEGLPDLLRTLLASSATVETDCILISRNARAITFVKRQHNGFPSQSEATQLAGEVVEINRDLDDICCPAGGNGDDGDDDAKIVYNKIRELGEVHSQSRYLDQVAQTLQAWSLIDSETHHVRFNHIIPIFTAPLIPASNGFVDQMCTPNDEVLQIRSPEGLGYITAAYYISQLAGKLRESGAVLSYAFGHHHTVTCTARMVWLSLCRQLLLQQTLLFSRSGMGSAILRLTSFSEANLRTLFDSLLQAASDDPVFCLIYCSQMHRKSAEEFLRQLQSLGRSATLRIILVLEDESQNNDTACSTNAERSFASHEDWFRSLSGDIKKLTIRRLIGENLHWHTHESSLIQILSEIPTAYVLGLAKMGWNGLPSSPPMRSTMADLIQSLPTSLEEWCEMTLQMIERPENYWVQAALHWVLHAVRPLSPLELAVAVTLRRPGETKSCSTLRDHIPCDIVGDLAKVIGPLIQSADNHVFLHDACHSVLVRRFCQVFSHEALLESCLDYLDLVVPQLKKASYHNPLLAPELGLLRYVTLCWPRHCQEDESDKSVIRVLQFLSRKRHCGVWVKWYNELERNGDPIPEVEQTPLQIACRFGLIGLVKHCIPITKAAENAQSIMNGALEIAARYGYEGVIKVLLSHDAVASPRALSLAVKTGSESCVAEIIHAGLNVDQEDEKGYSPLHYSVLAGSSGNTALLLANGATIDKAGPDGATALHLAAMTGQNVMVEGLLKSNATIDLPDASGYDALKAAARAGSSGIVKLLIEAGANPDTFANDGNDALHVALEAGDLAVITIILDRTQDVTSCNNAGYRPLDLATQQGNLHALQELIQRLANSNADDVMQCDDESTEDTWRFPEDSRLPLLAIAARHGHRDIIKWLLQSSDPIGREAGSWAIYEAAAGGHAEVLEELLPRGESEKWPVALDQMGRTPLHMTAERGNRAALEELLKYRQFHVGMTDDRKRTALHQAAASGNNDIIDLLIENGAVIAYEDDEEKTPLHIAAQEGQLKALQQLLTVMSEVDMMDAESQTPFSLAVEQGHTEIVSYFYETYDFASDPEYYKFVLHRAALWGHDDLVRFFIDHRWDFNSRDMLGRTPLDLAAENNHLQAAIMLIDAGADVDTVDEYGRTPLYYAASENSLNVAQRLLEAEANPNHRDNHDDTPLYKAAYKGALGVVKVLLSRLSREELNLQCSDGWTALHAAYDAPEIVKTLLAAGANPFILDNYSRTSLSLAFGNDYEETCNELISAMEKQALQDVNLQMAAIHEIAAVGNIQALDRLFVSGVDLDIRGEDGATALHRACRNGQKETVEMLIQRGADIQRVSSRWGAPIAAASAGGSTDIVELLLSKGVKIDSVDEENDTALTLALATGHTEVARLLLENGANLNHMGRKHGSALKIAIEREDLDFVKLLLENGANAALDIPGFPPLLHIAAETNNRGIMEALVEAGTSDLAVCDSAGRSLLSVAILNKAQQIVDFLLEHQELNLDVQDVAGRTALSIAAAQGSHVVAEMLLRKASPDIPDMEGKTALIYSILSEDIQTIQELLQHQASLAVSDARGRNPLYWACLTDNTEVFEIILRVIQDSESLLSLSKDALQAAVAVKRSDFVQKLLSNPGVNPNTPSPDGWSPLFTAQHLKLPEIERQLLDANAVENIPTSGEPYPRPSRFHPQDRHVALHVSETGKEVTVGGVCPIDPYNTNQPRGAIRADYPMSGIGFFYFEVTIEKGAAEDIIGVGFCDEKAPLHRMLGWDEGSWGYHGDDGKSYEREVGTEYGDVYSTGDTIGCCVNPSQGTAFYTINGKPLRIAFHGLEGKLYPAVSFDVTSASLGCSVSINFGGHPAQPFQFQGPFYDLEIPRPPSPLPGESPAIDSITRMRRASRRKRFLMSTLS